MADVILNRKEIQAILDDGSIGVQYTNCADTAYLPVSLAVDVIEKNKKNGSKYPSELKHLIDGIPSVVTLIPLSPKGLSEAINDQDFCNKYVNSLGNPIAFATEASIYEYEGCWDRNEMIQSFQELSWT